MARAGRRARQRAARIRAASRLHRLDETSSASRDNNSIGDDDSSEEGSVDEQRLPPKEIFYQYSVRERFRDLVEFVKRTPGGLALLENRIRINPSLITLDDDQSKTLLHHAVALESEPDVTKILLYFGFNVNEGSMGGLRPLHIAAGRPNTEKVIVRLLDYGANVNTRDLMGRTPLMLAAHIDCKSNCEALIADGADVKAGDRITNWTALHYASSQPSARCVALLLDAGATPDQLAFDIAMVSGSTRGLYYLLRRQGGFGFGVRVAEAVTYHSGACKEKGDYMRRVHAAGGLGGYERSQRRKLVSLLRRHVAPHAPDDVLHVIVSFWGHAGSY